MDPFSLAFVAGNNRILYVAEKDERQVFLTDTSGDRIETVFADQKIRGPQTQFAWRPNSSLLAAYTYPMLQLFNIDTSDLCEVQMGEQIEVGPYWVWEGKWSPDGRYIALIMTAGWEGELLRFTGLRVLDMATGQLREYELPVDFVWDVSWASNGRDLVLLGQVDVKDGWPIQKLFLTDALTGRVRPMLRENMLGGGSNVGYQLDWSSDGQLIAVKCPVWPQAGLGLEGFQDQLCLIKVHRQ